MSRPIFISVPGSKSYTNRALLLASLASDKSNLLNCLQSKDTQHMAKALHALGVKIIKKSALETEILGTSGIFRKPRRPLFLGNAGTAVRFLAAVLAMQNFDAIVTGDERMQERPIKDLADALKQLGVSIEYLKKQGCPPIKIKGPVAGGTCVLNGNISSQFLSGLLMAAPYAKKPLKIRIKGELVSKPYIDVTLDLMKKFGVSVKNQNYRNFIVNPKKYRGATIKIEGDASSASYFFGAAALLGEKIRVKNIPKNSKQADAGFPNILNKMACGSAKNLKPLGKINLKNMPDSAMTAATLCCFAKGKSVLRGLENLRVKECDRLHALKTELTKIGIKVIELKDGLEIFGNPKAMLRSPRSGIPSAGQAQHDIKINTYNDHRIAMCFGMASLKIPHLIIENPACVEKTYPDFWKDLETLKSKIFAKKNIVLTGMRGSGKTILGKLLAKRLKRKFLDLDGLIEKQAKMKIYEIADGFGWKYFRKLEKNIVKKIAEESNVVIATGGGTLMYKENLKLLIKNSIIIFLRANIPLLKKRLKKDYERPSLTGRNTLHELGAVWKDRKDEYENAADYVLDIADSKTSANLNSLLKIVS